MAAHQSASMEQPEQRSSVVEEGALGQAAAAPTDTKLETGVKEKQRPLNHLAQAFGYREPAATSRCSSSTTAAVKKKFDKTRQLQHRHSALQAHGRGAKHGQHCHADEAGPCYIQEVVGDPHLTQEQVDAMWKP